MFDIYYNHRMCQCWGKSKLTKTPPLILSGITIHPSLHLLSLTPPLSCSLRHVNLISLFWFNFSISMATTLIQFLIISCLCTCYSLPIGPPISNLTLISLFSPEIKERSLKIKNGIPILPLLKHFSDTHSLQDKVPTLWQRNSSELQFSLISCSPHMYHCPLPFAPHCPNNTELLKIRDCEMLCDIL